MDPEAFPVQVGRARLACKQWGREVPEIVLLHHGLGSVGQWRRVPTALQRATGRCVLAYDRPGHGTSTPVPDGPWPVDWLHQEAERLEALLDRLGIERAVLVGHSDGGSVALIFAAARPHRVEALVSLAAHSYVEQVCIDRIARLRAEPGALIEGLARYHTRAAELFEAWSGVWVSEPFSRWDIRPDLGSICAPTIVVQGRQDEYGTDAMALDTATAIGDNAQTVLLDDVGHLVPQEAPDRTVDLVIGLLDRAADRELPGG